MTTTYVIAAIVFMLIGAGLAALAGYLWRRWFK
jgi:LPXTG-motif cell wall-anchored protein